MDNFSIGQRIRKQREMLGYTREEFAEKIDKSVKFCSDIEHGYKGISINTLCLISEVLLLSTDYILFGYTNEAVDDEAISLIKSCKQENTEELKTVMRIFVKIFDKACKNKEEI